YNTRRYSIVKNGWAITDFSARLLTDEERERALDPYPWLVDAVEESGFGEDCPLLRQRMTDVYMSVVRLPDPPHLREAEGGVELIPGENHRETFGYHLLRGGERITDEPIRPGARFTIDEPGAYTAVAVEWGGLEGHTSLPLTIDAGTRLRALEETPEDFSWTLDAWRVDGRLVSEEDAMAAETAVREVAHLHDGIIRRERYEQGALVSAEDLNANGYATRRCTFEDGVMRSREYWRPGDERVSRELFAQDGSKTEQIRWRHDRRPDEEINHWYYDHGMPVRMERRGTVHVKQGDEWVEVEQ
ncbi:MAG: hypothetical protein ACOCX2_12740, partial [Armatimonadota bacterium]